MQNSILNEELVKFPSNQVDNFSEKKRRKLQKKSLETKKPKKSGDYIVLNDYLNNAE